MIQAAGTTEQQARWLPGLASGETTAGIGTSELVADGAGAAVVVLIDGDDAVLVEAPEAQTLESIDSTRRFATVRGDGEPLAAHAVDRIYAAVSAEIVGVCQRALDMTRRVRQGTQAVRRPGRVVPGGLAPLRADAAGHRERALDRVLRGLGGRRRSRPAQRGRGARGRGGCRRRARA